MKRERDCVTGQDNGGWDRVLKKDLGLSASDTAKGMYLKMTMPSSNLTADAASLEKLLPTKVIITIMTPGRYKVCFCSFPFATHSVK